MANIDAHTRHLLVQNADLSRHRIEGSRKPRIDAIIDMCATYDIVWAVWSNGQCVVKGQQLVAEGAPKTNWIAIPCADEAEATALDNHLV